MKQFSSLGAFAMHLAEREVCMAIALTAGMERVAKKVEKTAKEKIGEYQEGVGGFPAWAPLADSTMREKERLGYAPPDNPLLRTGELRDSVQHEVVHGEGALGLDAIVGSEMEIAKYQEFGTSTIPPRPFIGPAAAENAELIAKTLGAAAVVGLIEGNVVSHTLDAWLGNEHADAYLFTAK